MPAAAKACSAHSAAARSLGTLSRSTMTRSHGHRLSISTAASCSHQKRFLSVKRITPNPACVPFRVAAAAMSTSTARPGLQFSAGSDEAALSEKLKTLLSPASADGASGRWTLIANGQGLERSFKFKTFAKTWVSDFSFSLNLDLVGIGTIQHRGTLEVGSRVGSEISATRTLPTSCFLVREINEGDSNWTLLCQE